jgi:hypothetical protein
VRRCSNASHIARRRHPRIQKLRESGIGLPDDFVRYTFSFRRGQIDSSKRGVMAGQIVITEKSSQAKDVRAAVGSRYGEILPAEGHLLDLLVARVTRTEGTVSSA